MNDQHYWPPRTPPTRTPIAILGSSCTSLLTDAKTQRELDKAAVLVEAKIPLAVGTRWDVAVFDVRGGITPDFDPAWVVRVDAQTREDYLNGFWRSLGWTVGPSRHMDPAWEAQIEGLDSATKPCPYVPGLSARDIERQEARWNGYICDSTNPDFRAWAQGRIEWKDGVLLERIGATPTYHGFASKDDFFRFPTKRRPNAGRPGNGGNLIPNTGGTEYFPPGAWEAGERAMIEWLLSTGRHPTARPHHWPEEEPFAWLPEEIRSRIRVVDRIV